MATTCLGCARFDHVFSWCEATELEVIPGLDGEGCPHREERGVVIEVEVMCPMVKEQHHD